MITDEEAREYYDKLGEYCSYHVEHEGCESCVFSWTGEDFRGRKVTLCDLNK